MKCSIKVESIARVNELSDVWSNKDFIELLKRFSYPDAEQVAESDLLDYLFMAINDFEPSDAAEIILTYKLSEKINQGQIHQLAHEMPDDKVAEDHSDISLHFTLFNINQLLYKAYNGRFPNTEASIIKFKLDVQANQGKDIDKELVVKALCLGLNDRNIIKRLFDDQLNGELPFVEAENILWELDDLGSYSYSITTSTYWLDEDDFLAMEFEGNISEFEEEEV